MCTIDRIGNGLSDDHQDLTLWTCILQNGVDLCVNQGDTLGSVELVSSLMKKERRKFNFYHCLVNDVDNNF